MDLDELLIAAAEAPPESRISFRDGVAYHGAAAIDRLMAGADVVGDPNYAAFAILTIRRRESSERARRLLALCAVRWAS